MVKPRLGIVECLFFAGTMLSMAYISDDTSSKPEPAPPRAVVLDNGQKCRMGENSTILCTDSNGEYQPVNISFSTPQASDKNQK